MQAALEAANKSTILPAEDIVKQLQAHNLQRKFTAPRIQADLYADDLTTTYGLAVTMNIARALKGYTAPGHRSSSPDRNHETATYTCLQWPCLFAAPSNTPLI